MGSPPVIGYPRTDSPPEDAKVVTVSENVDTKKVGLNVVIIGESSATGPTDLVLSNTSIAEGSPVNTLVANITAVGGTGPYTFTILSDPGNYFTITGSQLRLDNPSSPAGTYSVTIQVEDNNGFTYSEAFNITFVTGAFTDQQSVPFDGISRALSATFSGSPVDPGASSGDVAFFIDVRGLPQVDKTIAGRWDVSSASQQSFRLATDLSTGEFLRVQLKDTSGSGRKDYTATTNAIMDGNWHRIGFVFTGSVLSLYVDGVIQSTTNTIDDSISNVRFQGSSEIGWAADYNNSLPQNFFTGRLDEGALWIGTALSPLDVAEIYNGGLATDYNAITNPPSIWNRADASSGSVLQDATANNIDLALSGVASTDFVNDSVPVPRFFHSKSISLDGVNDFVDVGTQASIQFDVTDAFTWFGWIKGAGGGAAKTFLSNRNAGATGLAIGKSTSGNGHAVQWSFRQNNSRALSVLGSTSLSNASKWYAICVTYDGSNTSAGVKIYVDGALNTNTLISSNVSVSTVSTANYNFGRRGAQADQYYSNNITQWGVIDRELTFSEVLEHYNSGKVANYSGLSFGTEILHYWPLGDSPDTTSNVFDAIGSLDGVLNNGASIDLGDIP
jgi:hypothetical protein